jgi:hypothetical protein
VWSVAAACRTKKTCRSCTTVELSWRKANGSEALPEQVKNAGGLVSSSPRPGVPHRLEQDDVYEGYFLPKGSTVIANAWTMSFDPEYFPDPHAFKPERYLARDGTYDSSVLVVDFGFGRRFVG